MAALNIYSRSATQSCNMACIYGRTNCDAGCCQCDQDGNPITIGRNPHGPALARSCKADWDFVDGYEVTNINDAALKCCSGKAVYAAGGKYQCGDAMTQTSTCFPDNYLVNANGTDDAARKCCSGKVLRGVYPTEYYCDVTAIGTPSPDSVVIENFNTPPGPPGPPGTVSASAKSWIWWTAGGITLLLFLVLVWALAAGARSPQPSPPV